MTGFPRTGCHTSMQKLVAGLTVLLLALQIPAPSSARRSLQGGNDWGRSTASPPPQRRTLAVDLLPYHHSKSPFAQLNLTLSQRVEIAVTSSEARAELFANEISGKSATIGTEKVFTSPLQHSGGSYIMQISLGTPASTLWAIADTGSVLTWVQCTDCLNTHCLPQADPYFDPQASSSYSTIPCADPICIPQLGANIACSTASVCLYGIVYGDKSSTRGDLANDTLTLTGTDGQSEAFSSFTFGCGNNQTGKFGSSDGLVGLGKGDLSLIYQLGSEIDYAFSYCLVDFSVSLTKTSPLLLGSVGDLPLTYTPMVTNPIRANNFYYLDIIGITVDGVQLSYPAGAFDFDPNTREGGMVIDSGTTISQITAAAYDPFVSRLRPLITYPSVNRANQNFDLCYDISAVTDPTFPDVVLQFTNLDLALPKDNLIWSIDDSGNIVCIAFQRTTEGSVSILGSVQQQNFQIGYDLVQKQIGFAPTTC